MRARIVSVAASLVAVVAVAAAATAEPPTPLAPYAGRLTAVTIPITPLPSDAQAAPEGSAAPAAPGPASLVDPGTAPVPTLGPRAQPAADVRVVLKPTPTPRPQAAARSVSSGGGGGNVLRGRASWYCNNNGSRAPISACHYQYPDTGSFNAYAAAGPRLRAALGGGERWRNRVVSVDGIRVKLVDWCQCYQGQSNEKIIDLYYDVFLRAGGEVTIRW